MKGLFMAVRVSRSRRRAARFLLATAVMLGVLAPSAVSAVHPRHSAPAETAVGVVAAAPNPRAYVLHWPTHIVYAYDTVTGARVGGANVPTGTTQIIASPDGAFLYASKSFSPASTITVVSTATYRTVGTITGGKGSAAAAVSPDTITGNSHFNATIRDVVVATPPSADLGASLDAPPGRG